MGGDRFLLPSDGRDLPCDVGVFSPDGNHRRLRFLNRLLAYARSLFRHFSVRDALRYRSVDSSYVVYLDRSPRGSGAFRRSRGRVPFLAAGLRGCAG